MICRHGEGSICDGKAVRTHGISGADAAVRRYGPRKPARIMVEATGGGLLVRAAEYGRPRPGSDQSSARNRNNRTCHFSSHSFVAALDQIEHDQGKLHRLFWGDVLGCDITDNQAAV